MHDYAITWYAQQLLETVRGEERTLSSSEEEAEW